MVRGVKVGVPMMNRFETFAVLVADLNRCLQKIKETEMRKLGLKAGHTMCLYHLGQHREGITATQLAGFCREDKAAISRNLTQLMERGLVRRDEQGDKRSYRTLLFLTEEGLAVADRVEQMINTALTIGGEGLTDERKETFHESMEIIIANLTEYLKRQEML